MVEGKRVRDFGKGRKEGTMEASGRTKDEWMELWERPVERQEANGDKQPCGNLAL